MNEFSQHNLTNLNLKYSIWDRIFTVAPLVVIGTKEQEGYDLAPKHMAMPIGFKNYFGFVCTPNHGTYQNIKETSYFSVSFPLPNQITLTSLSASRRCDDITKFQQIITSLPTIKAPSIDALFLEDAYLHLECKLYKLIDGFDENSIITGEIVSAYARNDYLRVSEKDEQQQIKNNPLLAYVADGRFAKIENTYSFPFPKNFKK